MKRSEQFKVRATEQQMNDLRGIAEDMDLEMSTIIRSLVDRFIAHRKALGPRLIWPPEFAHFGEASPVVYGTAEETPTHLKVAEENTLVLEIPDELDADILARCADLGISVEEYALALLKGEVPKPHLS